MTLQPPLFPGVPSLRMVGKRLVEADTAACACCGLEFLPGPGRPRRTKGDVRKPAPLCRRCLDHGGSHERLRVYGLLIVGELLDGRFRRRWRPDRRAAVAEWKIAFGRGDADALERLARELVDVIGPEIRKRVANRSRYRDLRERAQVAALACLTHCANVARRRNNHECVEVAREQGTAGAGDLEAVGAGGGLEAVR